MKVALGIYTVFDALLEDIDSTFAKVAKMGYQGVEMFGEAIWDAEYVRSLLDKYGLEICGWHTEWVLLQDDTIDDTIAYHKALGNNMLIIPCLGGKWEIAHKVSENCEEIWHKHTSKMNQIAEKLHANGMEMGYHTHEHEFDVTFESGTPYKILLDDCGDNVVMELDTGNCIEGGGDPVEALKYSGKRSKLVHLKPYGKKAGFEVVLDDENDDNDWKAIVEQSKANDAEWLVVEDEAEKLGDKFKVAEDCLAAIKKYL